MLPLASIFPAGTGQRTPSLFLRACVGQLTNLKCKRAEDFASPHSNANTARMQHVGEREQARTACTEEEEEKDSEEFFIFTTY